jgi:RNA polymerase sigma factor (sigma-70 family)
VDDDDRAYFETLYRDHYGAVMRYAARRTDEQSARDVTAETFLVAWRRLDVIPRAGALPWLYATARNVLRHEQRDHARRSGLHERLEAQPASADADFADAVVDRMHGQQLLAALPPKEREAVQLVDWEHLDVRTAAEVVGCSPATFRVRLHRARRRLSTAVLLVPKAVEEVPS